MTERNAPAAPQLQAKTAEGPARAGQARVGSADDGSRQNCCGAPACQKLEGGCGCLKGKRTHDCGG